MNDRHKVKNIIMLIIYIKSVLVNLNLKVPFKSFFTMTMYVCMYYVNISEYMHLLSIKCSPLIADTAIWGKFLQYAQLPSCYHLHSTKQQYENFFSEKNINPGVEDGIRHTHAQQNEFSFAISTNNSRGMLNNDNLGRKKLNYIEYKGWQFVQKLKEKNPFKSIPWPPTKYAF